MLLVFDHNRLLFCALIFVFRNVFCHLLFHFTFSFLLILMTDFFPPSNDFSAGCSCSDFCRTASRSALRASRFLRLSSSFSLRTFSLCAFFAFFRCNFSSAFSFRRTSFNAAFPSLLCNCLLFCGCAYPHGMGRKQNKIPHRVSEQPRQRSQRSELTYHIP